MESSIIHDLDDMIIFCLTKNCKGCLYENNEKECAWHRAEIIQNTMDWIQKQDRIIMNLLRDKEELKNGRK